MAKLLVIDAGDVSHINRLTTTSIIHFTVGGGDSYLDIATGYHFYMAIVLEMLAIFVNVIINLYLEGLAIRQGNA